MAEKPRVLLIMKRALADRIEPSDLRRVESSPVLSVEELHAAARDHAHSLQEVKSALSGCTVREKLVEEVRADDADHCDVIVTVGGDGTVFAANALRTARPLITVNSDPKRSVGHFTRCHAAGFSRLFSAWQAGKSRIEQIHRLSVSIDRWKTQHCILNDCLFTSANPAAITRYVLEVGGKSELQSSSGVWISTAAGSTGGIRSAGMQPLAPTDNALLYKVREPFQGRAPAAMLSGKQTPPSGLRLTAAMPGIDLYIDGPHVRLSLPFGGSAEFTACAEPLSLIVI